MAHDFPTMPLPMIADARAWAVVKFASIASVQMPLAHQPVTFRVTGEIDSSNSPVRFGADLENKLIR